MTQLALGLDAPQPPPPERRIDITLARLAEIEESWSDAERAEIAAQLDADPRAAKAWSAIAIVARVRAMERGEEAAGLRPSGSLADIYDRLVQPGEEASQALLRVFAAAYGGPES